MEIVRSDQVVNIVSTERHFMGLSQTLAIDWDRGVLDMLQGVTVGVAQLWRGGREGS